MANKITGSSIFNAGNVCHKWKTIYFYACGGGKLGTRSGDSYVAFALPGK